MAGNTSIDSLEGIGPETWGKESVVKVTVLLIESRMLIRPHLIQLVKYLQYLWFRFCPSISK